MDERQKQKTQDGRKKKNMRKMVTVCPLLINTEKEMTPGLEKC